MSWRVARSLDVLLGQLNAAHPRRSRASDGGIGDAAHATRDSDHNPWVVDAGIGVVTARDYTHDPANGLDCEQLYQALIRSRDDRIKYVIWNRTITSGARDTAPWVRRPYSGSNPHTKHLHLSVRPEKARYDNAAPWAIAPSPAAKPAPAPEVDMLPREVEMLERIHFELTNQFQSRVPGSKVKDTAVGFLLNADSAAYQALQHTKTLSAAVTALTGLVAEQNGLTVDDVRRVVSEEIAKGVDVDVTVAPGTA